MLLSIVSYEVDVGLYKTLAETKACFSVLSLPSPLFLPSFLIPPLPVLSFLLFLPLLLFGIKRF